MSNIKNVPYVHINNHDIKIYGSVYDHDKDKYKHGILLSQTKGANSSISGYELLMLISQFETTYLNHEPTTVSIHVEIKQQNESED